MRQGGPALSDPEVTMSTVPTNAIVEAIRGALESQAAIAAEARATVARFESDDPEALVSAAVRESERYLAEVAPLLAQADAIMALISEEIRPTLSVPTPEEREAANADATEATKVYRKLLAAFTEAGGDADSLSDVAKGIASAKRASGGAPGDTRRPRFSSITVQALHDEARRVAYPLTVRKSDGSEEVQKPTFTQVADYCQNGITTAILQSHYFDSSVGGESHQKIDLGSGDTVRFTVTSPESSKSWEISVTR